MSRIPYLRDEEAGADEVVAPIRQRRGGKLLNLDRQLLYSPPLALGWNELLGAVRTRLAVPARLREIAICAVAIINDAPYEFLHHAPELLKAGGTPAQVEALKDVATALKRTDIFDRAALAVLRLAAEMTERVKVQESTFSELRAALADDRYVVELVATVAAYNMVSRVIVALGIEPEDHAPSAHPSDICTMSARGRVNVPGAAIAYSMKGPDDAPVLMLANELGADMRLWDGVLGRLESHYRVLRYDTRGHGASSTPPGSYSIAALTDDAIALLDALKVPCVHFVGASLGGMVGQQLAARYPNRVAGLVLCAATSTQPAPEIWSERIAMVKTAGLEAIADATLEHWFTPEFLRNSPIVEATMRAMFLGTRAAGWLACAGPIRDLSQNAMLAQIHAPTLLIAGANDVVASPEAMQPLRDQIRHSRLQVINDAAHLPHVEQPDAFCDAVLEFLSSVDRKAPAARA